MFYWKSIIWLSILLHKILFSHKFQLSELKWKCLWFMGWVFCFFIYDATWNKWEQYYYYYYYVLLKFRTALFERRLMQISAQDLPLPLHPITLNKLMVRPPPLSVLTTQSWMSLCIVWQECKLQDVSNINVVGLRGGGVLPYMAYMGGQGIVFLLSVLNRVYNFVQVCYRRIFADVIYCLDFSS